MLDANVLIYWERSECEKVLTNDGKIVSEWSESDSEQCSLEPDPMDENLLLYRLVNLWKNFS